MQKLVALLLIAVLAGSVTIPNVFSDEEQNDNQNQSNTQESENDDHGNQNKTKGNDDNDNEKDNKIKMHFGFSNATSITVTLPNGTHLTFGFSNGTNPGQQISNFIHQIRDAFKQQEDLAKKTIKDCREKAKDAANPTDKKAIMEQCKIQLKQINQQFKSEHKLFQLDFKQFREVIIGNNQENHEKPKDNDTKIKNTALVIPPHVPEKPHGKNTTQSTTPPNQHGLDEKQKHANQNGNQKPGKKD